MHMQTSLQIAWCALHELCNVQREETHYAMAVSMKEKLTDQSQTRKKARVAACMQH